MAGYDGGDGLLHVTQRPPQVEKRDLYNYIPGSMLLPLQLFTLLAYNRQQSGLPSHVLSGFFTGGLIPYYIDILSYLTANTNMTFLMTDATPD